MSSTQLMRVGYVLKMYPRFSETFIVNEILAHEAAGLDVEIFSLRHPSDGRFHEALARIRAPVTYFPHTGVKITDFWTVLSEAGAALPGLLRMLDCAHGEEADSVFQALLLARESHARGITHFHAHFGSSATTVARLASRFTGIPYSFTAHAKDIFHEDVQAEDLRHKLHDAAAVVTVSDYNWHYLRDTYGPAAARVQRIYNGLDLDQFSYTPPAERPRRIVAVGRLVEKKGFADLIEACAVLHKNQHKFQCQIIGTGPLEAELHNLIAQRGLQDQVTLLGPRPQDQVIDYVRQAAVLAAPCIVGADGNRDGLPTVLLEAMALGTPCVATDVTGIPEVVRDGDTGIIVLQHNPHTLAEALRCLLDDATLRVQIATAARRLIEAEFDIHHNTDQMRSLFTTTSDSQLLTLQTEVA